MVFQFRTNHATLELSFPRRERVDLIPRLSSLSSAVEYVLILF